MARILTPFPGTLEQVDGSVDPFPVSQMEEGVRDCLTVSTFQNVLRRKDQWLHFQQILYSRQPRNLGKNYLLTRRS